MPDWGQVAMLVGVLVPSVILHEVSHGVVALWFGDATAARAGRLTLNPIRHIDPFGTVILPLILALSGLGAFGYAKPVPVNVAALHNPRQHALYVSLVGPAVNIVLALFAALVLRVFFVRERIGDVAFFEAGVATEVVFYFGLINVILAAFNLLPIPPLDGSAVVERFIPDRWRPAWFKMRQYSFGILLLIVLVLPNGLSRVFDPAIELWGRLL